jgi:hypothetical protein
VRMDRLVQMAGPMVAAALATVVLVGCGGSGGPGAKPETAESDCVFFALNFAARTAERLEPTDPRIPRAFRPFGDAAQAVVKYGQSGAAPVTLASDEIINMTGSPGRFVWEVTVTNQSSETFGATPDATVTGVEILVRSLKYYDTPGGTEIAGGGMMGATALSPISGLPIYNTGLSLAPGESTVYRSMQFSVPEGATATLVGLSVRADTPLVHLPTSADCYVSTIAGRQARGDQTGPVGSALFEEPKAMAADTDGTVYICDGQSLKKLSGGHISVLSYSSESDMKGAAVYALDYVAVALYGDCSIALVDKGEGSQHVIAGTGSAADKDGWGDAAMFDAPQGVDVVGDTIYVAEAGPGGCLRTVRYTKKGSRKDASSYYVETLASFNTPLEDVCVDGVGNVYVTDGEADHVYVIPRGEGTKYCIAGSAGPGYQDGSGAEARFSGTEGIDVDEAGNLYVADYYNHRIRAMYRTGSSLTNPNHWAVVTLAGSGTKGIRDGSGDQARLYYPHGLCFGPGGVIHFSGSEYIGRIDRLTPATAY